MLQFGLADEPTVHLCLAIVVSRLIHICREQLRKVN